MLGADTKPDMNARRREPVSRKGTQNVPNSRTGKMGRKLREELPSESKTIDLAEDSLIADSFSFSLKQSERV